MKILILGGTGAMGRYLIKLLEDDMDVESVDVTSRRKNASFGKVRYLQGNAKDNSFIKEVLKSTEYDAVVDFMSYGTQEFSERVDFLLDSTGHYMFLSSCRVYADFGTKPIVESSPRLLDVCKDEDYLRSDEYALAKAREEDILKSKVKKNWTIIRPYITYGDERLQLGIYEKEQWLFRALNGKPIVFSEEIGKNYTTLTWGGDVSRYIGKLLKIKATGETYHITGECKVKWDDVLALYLQTIENLTGVRPTVFMANPSYVPHSQKYQYRVDRCYNRVFDNSKLREIVGEKLEFAAIEKISECLINFVDSNRPFRPINWIYEAEMDRITHSRQQISKICGLKNKIRYLVYRYVPTLVSSTGG